ARKYRELAPYRDLYLHRATNNLPISQTGDASDYTNNINYFKRGEAIRQAFRDGGRDAAIFFTAPFAIMAAVESGAGYYGWQFLKSPFVTATGRYGQTAKVIAWMKFGNASADLTYQ